jgi:hypothetical protein
MPRYTMKQHESGLKIAASIGDREATASAARPIQRLVRDLTRRS